MGRSSRASDAVSALVLTLFESQRSLHGLAGILAAAQFQVGADIGGYYIHELRGLTTPICITPDGAWSALPFGPIPTWQAMTMHPGIKHLIAHHAVTAFSVTDIVSERVWLGSTVSTLMRPSWGRQYQCAIPVTGLANPTETHAWVFGRSGSNFTAADLDVCEALAPVLSAVSRHQAALQLPSAQNGGTGLFTQRQAAVIGLQAAGVSSAGIAVRLGISTRTTQKHIEHVYRTLGVHSRDQAVRAWNELGARGSAIPPEG